MLCLGILLIATALGVGLGLGLRRQGGESSKTSDNLLNASSQINPR